MKPHFYPQVRAKENYKTLRFDSLTALQNAILLYSKIKPADLVAELKLLKNLGGIDAQREKDMIRQRMQNSDLVAGEIINGMGDLSKPYHVQFKYNVPQPFIKCTIKAKRVDNHYELSIEGDRHSHQPEIDLAQALSKTSGATIGYYGYELERTEHVKNTHVEIPMQDITAVYALLRQEFNADDFLLQLNTAQFSKHNPDKKLRSTSPIVIFEADDMHVSFDVQSSHLAFPQMDPNKRIPDHGEYRIEGNFLVCNIAPQTEAASMISIKPFNQKTYDPKLKKRIQDLGEKLNEVLSTKHPAQTLQGISQKRQVRAEP